MTRTYQLPKGLSRTAAYRELSKKATKDFRGWTYNPRTGKATAT